MAKKVDLLFVIYLLLIFFQAYDANARSLPVNQNGALQITAKTTPSNIHHRHSGRTLQEAEEKTRQRIPKPDKKPKMLNPPNKRKRWDGRRKKRKKSSKNKTKPPIKKKKKVENDLQNSKKQSKEIEKSAKNKIELINIDIEECLEKIIALIPKKINASYQKSEKDFTRDRQLPFPKLIVFVLSLTASGKCEGVDIKSGKFFKNAKRSDLWPNAEAVHRSTITKARQKLDWRIFKDIFRDSVDLAYDLWPKDASTYEWHGMSVFAVDGSTCILPASKEIREEFDKDSGLENIGRGHYPECLVSTVYDVFRRIPIARTIVGKDDACERTQAKAMIKHIPSGSIILFDRGYPSYMFIFSLIENHKGYFILRCPAKNSFKAIDEFIKSSKDEDIIYINPPDKLTKKEREQLNPIKLRIVKLTSPDGEVSVLLTNLYDEQTFTANEIIELYFRRWEVENHYRDEKVYLEIEKFHARLPNGVRQELFAILIMTVISKLLMALTKEGKIESQFKGAIMGLASEAAILAPEYPKKSVEIFREVLKEISRIKYYRPKTPRPSQPRVTKRPNNKWNKDKVKKAKETKSKKIRDP